MFAAGKTGEELRQHMGKGYEASQSPADGAPRNESRTTDIDGVLAEILYTGVGTPLFGLDVGV